MSSIPSEHQTSGAVDSLVFRLLEATEAEDGVTSGYANAPGFGNGRYRLGRPLGSGAMGRVFRALDSETGCEVAIKILHPEHLEDQPLRDRFLEESRLLARCEHPGTVELLDSGVNAEDGLPYFTMRLMESSLRPWIGKPLRLERVLKWMRTACRAVAHAHSLGIVHRDLKPSNILLCPGGLDIKIADFSLAEKNTSDPGHSDVGEDLRALGELFYLLLTGQPPRMHCPPPSRIAGVPQACDAICRKAALGPDGRGFSSVMQMEAALAGVERHPAARSRVWRRAVAAVAVAAAVIGAILLRPHAPEADVTRSGIAPEDPPSSQRGWRLLESLEPAENPASASRTRPYVADGGLRFIPVPGHPRVLLSATEVRRADFAAFCNTLTDEEKRTVLSWVSQVEPVLPKRPLLTWKDTCAADDDPAAGVSWRGADAFCRWLTSRERASGRLPEGAFYRLPWAAEWFAACGVDVSAFSNKPWPADPVFPWGKAWPPPPDAGNFPGLETSADERRPSQWPILNRRDPFQRGAPVGSFPANPAGFLDMAGNLSEWALDRPAARERDRPARLVLGSNWMHVPSVEHPLEPSYDYEEAAVDARGFRPALQLAPTPAPLPHLTLHRVSDATGAAHSENPGIPLDSAPPNRIVRITWRVENYGGSSVAFVVRSNALSVGAGGKTVYRSPGNSGRPALGGGIVRSGRLAPGEAGFYSFDMDITGWPVGPVRISSSLHADKPDGECLETSSPGAGLSWLPPDWWCDAFTITDT
ncbi:MAG: SUMF1/EgtB/PvdO family nonheme iron enzyme [Verrucomicrobia bacterium]|nr:SUMF1/EgtB/PvdO family nonheme iron enzyme [Verrucomicrobiota bacterium]